jgi:hypothetical protein
MEQINKFYEILKYAPYQLSENIALVHPVLDSHKGVGFKMEPWSNRAYRF